MNGAIRERLGTIDRGTAGRAAVAVGIFVLLVGIIGITGPANGPGGSPAPSGQPTQVAQGTPGPSTGPTLGPTRPPEPWEDLVVPPYVKTAELTPSDLDRIGVASNATFTLRSLNATPALSLAAGLSIKPAIEFSVKATASADEAIIRPSTALVEGTRYRFELANPDGSLAGAWAFIARAPLHVVATLPGDKAIRVPLNTGIEVTFDQDGATDVASHLAITPAVKGRVEAHGRTFAFVPEQPLVAATIYTVTVRSGVGLDDSTEQLEKDVVFQFETAAGTSSVARLDFARPVIEVRPNVSPVLLLQDDEIDEDERPKTARVAVDRLPSFAAAIDAARRLAGAAGWAVASPEALVPTGALDHVTSVDAEVTYSESGPIVLVPVQLPSGRYVLTVAQDSGPAQLLLLVTNLATYAVVGTETTVVWVNDLAAGTPVQAAIAFADGTQLGRSDAAGILRIATPKRLKDSPITGDEDAPPTAADILTIRDDAGRSTLVPLGLPVVWGYAGWYGDGEYDPAVAPSRWWTLFATDRVAYRQTDTIHLWGLLRARSDRSVPTDVEVRLRPEGSDDVAPIMRRALTLSDRGTFIADLELTELPRGSYSIDLVAKGATVASVWVSVTEIRKPAYRIDVTLDHPVYVTGTSAVITATTTFYDGTSVPGLDLTFEAFGKRVTGVTNAAGVATVTLTAAPEDRTEFDELYRRDVSVRPVHPEEGEIWGEAHVTIVPARVWLTASGTVSAGNLVVDGRLTQVDLAALEAAILGGNYPDTPPGRPAGGQVVEANVTRLVVTRTQIGTEYDYITKKAVPAYRYETTKVAVGTYQLKSAADGAVHLSVAVPDPASTYEVVLNVSDAERRSFARTLGVSAPDKSIHWWDQAYLQRSGGEPSEHRYEVGDTVSITFHRADDRVASGGRFLFIVAREGRLEAVAQPEPTFERPFRDADLPGYTIRGVWVTSTGFAVADTEAQVDPESKRLQVSMTADKPRYEPGGEASIAIRTLSPSGQPVAADVIVQALDQKLFTMGLAYDDDPLWSLLQLGPAGFVQSYASHVTPFGLGGGMGDEGGGRDDFQDSATFQRVRTDASGRATLRFTLPDDLTGWHVTATALSAALDAGQASIVLPTGLPFFVDAILAPEYLIGEAPILRLRAYGDALTAGTSVQFVVSSVGLGLNATVSTTAFEAERVPLPALPAGTHRITVSATATRGDAVLRDTLVRTVTVVPSRLESLATRIDQLGAGFVPTGGDGLTTYLVMDAGRGSIIALLESLATSSGPRFDQSAGAAAARDLLVNEFGVDPTSLPPAGYDQGLYQQDCLALLPYASGSLDLAATAALTVPTWVRRDALFNCFTETLDDDSATRERRIQALAGLAALGENVLGDLRSYEWATLALREQLWLALGLAASGDEDGARTIEQAVLEAKGQRLGQWVRLDAGGTLETSRQATALLLVLAARIGDPLAADMARYLIDQPSRESLVALELLAYAQSALDRLPRSAGRFAVTVDGKRTEVALKPGGSYALVLTRQQRSGMSLERLDGSLEVVTSWTATDAALPADPSLSVTRTVSPAGTMDGDGLVRVTLKVTFGPKAPDGCYRLTDLVPSGLAPVISTAAVWDDEGLQTIGPYEVEGQRVSWCASPDDRSFTYGYRARVVSPGTYRWEPAVLQAAVAPSLGASTPASTYRIN